MTTTKKATTKKKTKIPAIPFTFEEVYALTQYQASASDELWNRFRVWKAGHDYVFIRSLSTLIIKDYAGHNWVLSTQEKELKKTYIDWLVGLESDKFKALDNIKLDHNNKVKKNEEEYYNDMLTHSGVL